MTHSCVEEREASCCEANSYISDFTLVPECYAVTNDFRKTEVGVERSKVLLLGGSRETSPLVKGSSLLGRSSWTWLV